MIPPPAANETSRRPGFGFYDITQSGHVPPHFQIPYSSRHSTRPNRSRLQDVNQDEVCILDA
jgi:hypothetical protein